MYADLKQRTNPDDIERSLPQLDLLWSYYVKQGRFHSAVIPLRSLAIADFPLSIYVRYRYLLHAKMQAEKSTEEGAIELLDEIRDRIALANIQTQIRDEIGKMEMAKNANNQDFVNRQRNLQLLLLGSTELYKAYAKPFKLYGCQLLLLHFSRHNDSKLVESIWRKIIKLRDWGTVHSLGKEFGGPCAFFPLLFLCENLEAQRPSRKTVGFCCGSHERNWRHKCGLILQCV